MDGFFHTCSAIPSAVVVGALVELNQSCTVQTAGIVAWTADVLATAGSGRRQLPHGGPRSQNEIKAEDTRRRFGFEAPDQIPAAR